MNSLEGPLWKEVIKSEIDSILQNRTWELVDLPPASKPLGYKWIFKKKMKADGTIDKYKARLIIKGYKKKRNVLITLILISGDENKFNKNGTCNCCIAEFGSSSNGCNNYIS